MSLITFTTLCNHHHFPPPECFHHCKPKALYPLNNNSLPLLAVLLCPHSSKEPDPCQTAWNTPTCSQNHNILLIIREQRLSLYYERSTWYHTHKNVLEKETKIFKFYIHLWITHFSMQLSTEWGERWGCYYISWCMGLKGSEREGWAKSYIYLVNWLQMKPSCQIPNGWIYFCIRQVLCFLSPDIL